MPGSLERTLIQTASQTVGPFFHDSLIYGLQNDLLEPQTVGERILFTGRVLDGDAAPIPDAMIELWQADASGRFNHPSDPESALSDKHFRGFGRSGTDADGRYRFRTIKPASIARGGEAVQAPHIDVRVFSRGLLIHLVTRAYFSDEPLNENDAVLKAVPPERRSTLIAVREDAPDGLAYRFDIRMQGDGETVFFDV